MKKINYIIGLLSGALSLWSGCTKDGDPTVGGAGEVPVSLSAVASKSVTQTNIYLTALQAKNESIVYIPETLISVQGGLDTVAHNITFSGGTPYYPLGNDSLRFFAYSGRDDGNGNMQLTAGLGEQYDAVLSNYGRRVSETTIDPSGEGFGTLGSSKDPAELLQFRHVMTQVTVEVIVDSTETPSYVDPPPTKVQFTMDSLLLRGTYPIRATAPVEGRESEAELATGSGLTTLHLGTNYLIPNGMDLSGKTFRTLAIDDYTASQADLSQFVISPESSAMTTRLYPGYAYKLVITVRRLGVTSVTIKQVPWEVKELDDEEPSYLNRTLTLDLGSEYQNTGEDEVTKVVLHTTNDRLYVGHASDTMNLVHFVTLPQSDVYLVDLYTDKGLLLSTPVSTEYNAYTLTLPISTGGMLPVDPAQSYGAGNPYAVSTPVQLLNLSKAPSEFYRQTANLDMDALDYDGTDSFEGLGDFSGVYDGDGYWISDVIMTGNGLFDTNTGELRNVRIITGTIDGTGSPYVGSLCGVNNGLIIGCLNEAFIKNVEDTAGGICGQNGSNGYIIATVNTGFINGGNTLGGICGSNPNTSEGAISACLNFGSMTATATSLAGICGISSPSADTLLRTCFWLVGSAQRSIGGSEVAVSTSGIRVYDTTNLDPNKMRNGLAEEEGPEDLILNRLNKEIDRTPYSGEYEYILDSVATGITWPAPVKL